MFEEIKEIEFKKKLQAKTCEKWERKATWVSAGT